MHAIWSITIMCRPQLNTDPAGSGEMTSSVVAIDIQLRQRDDVLAIPTTWRVLRGTMSIPLEEFE